MSDELLAYDFREATLMIAELRTEVAQLKEALGEAKIVFDNNSTCGENTCVQCADVVHAWLTKHSALIAREQKEGEGNDE